MKLHVKQSILWRNKMILKCTCNNEYQDSRYGLKMRVFNPLKKGLGKVRCTICKTEIPFKESESKEERTKKRDE